VAEVEVEVRATMRLGWVVGVVLALALSVFFDVVLSVPFSVLLDSAPESVVALAPESLPAWEGSEAGEEDGWDGELTVEAVADAECEWPDDDRLLPA
jgi:hypothetical protein